MSLLAHDSAVQMLGPAAFLATVVDVNDPLSRNRVQVRIYNTDGVDDQDGPVWARVAVPFAGGNRGAFFIPDVGDEVVVVFLAATRDSRSSSAVSGMAKILHRKPWVDRATLSTDGPSPAKRARASRSSKTVPGPPSV